MSASSAGDSTSASRLSLPLQANLDERGVCKRPTTTSFDLLGRQQDTQAPRPERPPPFRHDDHLLPDLANARFPARLLLSFHCALLSLTLVSTVERSLYLFVLAPLLLTLPASSNSSIRGASHWSVFPHSKVRISLRSFEQTSKGKYSFP